MLKGHGEYDGLVGSTHGGWKFNYNPPYLYVTNGLPAFYSPSQASTIPSSQLQTNAFFDVTSTNFGTSDLALFGSSGSGYAQANRNRILSDAIPELTLPIGANPLSLAVVDDNFDEQADFENGWPADRPAREVGAAAAGEWHHSDFHQVAYPFTYLMFDEFVTLGNLK